MSDDKDNVESLKPGKSLVENAFNKLLEQKKKDKKAEVDKQVKTTTDAYAVFRKELDKMRALEDEYKEIDEDRSILTAMGIN